VHGFFKIYYSTLDTKLKLAFDMYESYKNKLIRYDFDKDGFIRKEDVRLVLTHVPIEKTVLGHVEAEGRFTREGGGK
jgi:Ca2+-binding EF-hand superfamily protein